MNQLASIFVSSGFMVSAAFGVLGGVVRAVVDFVKYSFEKQKSKKTELRGVLFCFLSLILMGAFMGIVLSYNWALSMLAGYAAQDILDVLYKSMNAVRIKAK